MLRKAPSRRQARLQPPRVLRHWHRWVDTGDDDGWRVYECRCGAYRLGV
jgi:hypothetical protein